MRELIKVLNSKAAEGSFNQEFVAHSTLDKFYASNFGEFVDIELQSKMSVRWEINFLMESLINLIMERFVPIQCKSPSVIDDGPSLSI